jgi:peptidoglycan-associated lipoprotein
MRPAIVLIEGQCARAYLVARGIAASRMLIVSYGEERPTCVERTEACWAKNRRSHFLAKSEQTQTRRRPQVLARR